MTPEQRRAYEREYRRRNLEKVRAKEQRYRARRREEYNARKQQWKRDNPEKVLDQQRRHRAANPGYHVAKSRRWQQRHPEVVAAAVRRREAVKRGAMIVPFTAEQLMQRLSMFDGCWMCGGTADTIDHVKPLAAGGAHALCNLRPACSPCNVRKGATWPFAA